MLDFDKVEMVRYGPSLISILSPTFPVYIQALKAHDKTKRSKIFWEYVYSHFNRITRVLLA